MESDWNFYIGSHISDNLEKNIVGYHLMIRMWNIAESRGLETHGLPGTFFLREQEGVAPTDYII